MFSQEIQFWDIATVVVVVGIAAYYLYRKLIAKKNHGDCSSCPSCDKSSKK